MKDSDAALFPGCSERRYRCTPLFERLGKPRSEPSGPGRENMSTAVVGHLLRRVNGRLHLSALRDALQRHGTPETVRAECCNKDVT